MGMNKMVLEGITVADFGNAWAGPLFARTLGDMGARVIKVESLKHMDVTRLLPPWLPGQEKTLNNSGYYNYMNRNKLAVQLDVSTPKGLELCKKILAIADILVENYAFGVMGRLGLGYEEVRKVNPRIIYVSMTSLGSAGPMKNYVMYGRPQVYLSGLAHTTGYPDQAPHSLNISWGDPVASYHGLFAALSALRYRQKTGKGQFIELSQWEGLISVQPESMMDYILNKRVRVRQANRDEFMAPHNAYRCKGGDLKWVTIAVASDEEWASLCSAMGNPAWTKEDKFADGYSRWKNQEEMDRHIEAWTQNYMQYEVTEMLQKVGVAAFPCLSNRGLVEDPHLKARGFFEEWDHPEIGKRKYDGLTWKMSKTPGRIGKRAPLVGEHNNYVFGELLGLSQEEIDRLVQEKILF
jgi:crotonobetainyl-CoA:carnitine CoA-transferase CaiB-like acyl-CoA transferase